jgi:hypothetical protein
MAVNPQEFFERYVHLGPISRNADAVAEMFTPDGVFEAPLVPADHTVPRRMEGHEEIRTGLAAYYERTSTSRSGVMVAVAGATGSRNRYAWP